MRILVSGTKQFEYDKIPHPWYENIFFVQNYSHFLRYLLLCPVLNQCASVEWSHNQFCIAWFFHSLLYYFSYHLFIRMIMSYRKWSVGLNRFMQYILICITFGIVLSFPSFQFTLWMCLRYITVIQTLMKWRYHFQPFIYRMPWL